LAAELHSNDWLEKEKKIIIIKREEDEGSKYEAVQTNS
jgi:hypothetical protein